MKEKLLLLHGALGSAKQFDPVIDNLSDTFDVYTLDFDGHGGKKPNKDFSIELFSENVIDFLEVNSIQKVNIFGYSMGGYVALQAALKIPNKISKITTLGTKFDWTPDSAAKEIKMLNPIKIEEKVPQFAEKLKHEHHPQDWKIVMQKTAKMMKQMGNGARLSDSDFKNINVPVTIGIGSLDKMVSFEESKYAASLLPNSKLIVLNNIEHPIEKFPTDQLINFIRSTLLSN